MPSCVFQHNISFKKFLTREVWILDIANKLQLRVTNFKMAHSQYNWFKVNLLRDHVALSENARFQFIFRTFESVMD